MLTKDEIIELAQNENYTVGEITYGMNGYPKGLGDHNITRMYSEEMIAFIKETDYVGDIVLFKLKAGHHFWKKEGPVYVDKLDVDFYLNVCGENYMETSREYILDKLDVIDDDMEMSDIIKLLGDVKEELEEFDGLEEGDSLVTHYGENGEVYHPDTSFSHDSTIYAIGLFLPSDYDEVNELNNN